MEPPGPKDQEPQGTAEDRVPPLSFREYRSQHDGCWVCYGKGNNHAHDHRHRKVYEEDKKTYFALLPTRSPRSNEWPIGRQRAETVEKAKERAKGKAEEKAMVEDPAQTDA